MLGFAFGFILVLEHLQNKSIKERADIAFQFLMSLMIFQVLMVVQKQLLDENNATIANRAVISEPPPAVPASGGAKPRSEDAEASSTEVRRHSNKGPLRHYE